MLQCCRATHGSQSTLGSLPPTAHPHPLSTSIPNPQHTHTNSAHPHPHPLPLRGRRVGEEAIRTGTERARVLLFKAAREAVKLALELGREGSSLGAEGVQRQVRCAWPPGAVGL